MNEDITNRSYFIFVFVFIDIFNVRKPSEPDRCLAIDIGYWGSRASLWLKEVREKGERHVWVLHLALQMVWPCPSNAVFGTVSTSNLIGMLTRMAADERIFPNSTAANRYTYATCPLCTVYNSRAVCIQQMVSWKSMRIESTLRLNVVMTRSDGQKQASTHTHTQRTYNKNAVIVELGACIYRSETTTYMRKKNPKKASEKIQSTKIAKKKKTQNKTKNRSREINIK